MNYILNIYSPDDGKDYPIVLVHLGEINPTDAALVVLNALKAMPTPKKKRSDAGKSRKPATTQA